MKDEQRIFILRAAMITGVILVFAVLFFIGLRLNSQGRLTVLLDSDVQQLVITSNEGTVEVQNPSRKTTLTLSSGEYRIDVLNDDGSYSALVVVPTFFRSATVSASLAEERGRSFVVNRPKSCVHPLGDSFVSYSCGGTLFTMNYHTTGSINTPASLTSARDVFAEVGELENIDPGLIEGVFAYKNNTYMLIKASEFFGTGHLLYQLSSVNGAFDITFVRVLDSLNPDELFSVSLNGDEVRFIPLNGFYYYSSTNLEELSIVTLEGERENETVSSLQSIDEGLAVLLGVTISGEDGLETATGGIVKTLQNGVEKTVRVDTVVQKAQSCLDLRICTLDEGGVFTVYDKSLDVLFKDSSVRDFHIADDEVYVVNQLGVVLYEETESILQGSYVYRNVYPVSSIQEINENLYMNVTVNETVYTMRVETTEGRMEKFDEILQPLFENVFTETLSISDPYIHLTLDIGEGSINRETGSYTLDQEVINAAVNSTVNILKDINIEQYNYKIVSPFIN